MQDITICTNKLIYALFNICGTDIKETKKYVEKAIVTFYYVESLYEDSSKNIYKIRVSSKEKNMLRFSIDEIYLYLILIMNAKRSNIEPYYMTMRKLRDIRCLSSDSLSTYNRHIRALERLSKKEISIVPIKSNYKNKPIFSRMLTYNLINSCKGRFLEFNYSFDALTNTVINTRQNIMLSFNPFAYSMRQVFMFQASLYLIRMIFINRKKYKSRKISFQKVLLEVYRFDENGIMLDQNYYNYILNSKNKQSELLENCYSCINKILLMMKKAHFIKAYAITLRKSFKYVRDNEVFISIEFI